MSFAKIEPRTESTEFSRVVYTTIREGYPIRLRVLDEEARPEFKHYIPTAKVSVVCLGFDACPVCQNNKKLIDNNPNVKPNQIRGYFSRQSRYLVNVLNRTPCKRTSTGELVFPLNGVYPVTDPKTGEQLTNVEPSPANRVEVLERGVTLFSQLNVINDTLTDAEGNRLGLWNYDIIISATGSGTSMVTTVTPNVAINDKIDLEEMGLTAYDLSTVSLNLKAEEIEQLLRGVSLKDIFSSQTVQESLSKTPVEPSASVDQTIAELFQD